MGGRGWSVHKLLVRPSVRNGLVLADVALGPITIEDPRKSIRHYVGEDGTWLFDSFKHLLPATECMKNAATYPPLLMGGDDEITWSSNVNGDCTVKSAHELIRTTPC